MDKKVYMAPEVELIETELSNSILTVSLEDPAIGGSEAGYSDPSTFDPS